MNCSVVSLFVVTCDRPLDAEHFLQRRSFFPFSRNVSSFMSVSTDNSLALACNCTNKPSAAIINIFFIILFLLFHSFLHSLIVFNLRTLNGGEVLATLPAIGTQCGKQCILVFLHGNEPDY